MLVVVRLLGKSTAYRSVRLDASYTSRVRVVSLSHRLGFSGGRRVAFGPRLPEAAALPVVRRLGDGHRDPFISGARRGSRVRVGDLPI